MKNKFTLLCMLTLPIYMLIGCAKSNPSGSIKRALKKGDGKWQVTQIDEYHYGLYYPEYVYSLDLDVTGEFYFNDEGDPPIAGDFGTWTPINGSKEDIIYQIADTDNKLTCAIWGWENNQTTDHDGYKIHDGWDKTTIVLENSTTVGDTIIVHKKTLHKL